MKSLKEKLIEYTKSGIYPMHMPGHKRNMALFSDVANIEDIDFTEVEGLDNLHDPEGIIKESIDKTAEYLGTDKTYYLVNGSTIGILVAIQSVTDIGDSIIVARNSHKSVYNAVTIRNLKPSYLYPKTVNGLFDGGYDKEELDALLKESGAKAVIITSPTYEGVVADVKGLAEVAHENDAALIVDSAHGAHFVLDGFPNPAYKEGADIVIESVHKTLPSLTQTALMHVMGDRVNKARLESTLNSYQSSSPSYIFMASIDECMKITKKANPKELLKTLEKIREDVNNTGKIHIPGLKIVGSNEVYDYDLGKLVIDLSETNITGTELQKILREKYKFETEMANNQYVIAMTSIADDLEKVKEFGEALVEIAEGLDLKDSHRTENVDDRIKNEVKFSPHDALNRECEDVSLSDTKGRVAGDYIYKYPPGIPLVVPGEIISENLIKEVEKSLESGLQIKGITDKITSGIKVIKE